MDKIPTFKCITLALLFCFSSYFAQNSKLKQVATIAFYNVENLWDTNASIDYIDGTKDPKNPLFHRSTTLDSINKLEHDSTYRGVYSDEALKSKKVFRKQILANDFTPNSPKNYTNEIYQKKLKNASRVIADLGKKYTNIPPVVIGLVEVENRQVLQDLVKQENLEKYEYGIIHFNSFDARGIDIGLIYQSRRFVPTDYYKKELAIYDENAKREYTRDLLVVKGLLDGEKFAFFVNHWPSRRGGEAVSLMKRNAAASLLRKEMEAVLLLDKEYKLIAMGDFNDDPISESIQKILKARGDEKLLEKDASLYYNPMETMFRKGFGTLAYKDVMSLFDQLIFSQNLKLKTAEAIENAYKIYKTEIYSPSYLITKEGNFKGYPFRSWNGDNFTEGYSDHFPVYSVLYRNAE